MPHNHPISVKQVELEAILPLRASVLRPGLSFEKALFDGDREDSSVHVAVLFGPQVVGCGTLLERETDWFPRPDSWQIRGMATHEKYRGAGVGKRVLKELLKAASEKAAKLVWCNARIEAVGFYRSNGFEIKGELFEIKGIGPHHFMYLNL